MNVKLYAYNFYNTKLSNEVAVASRFAILTVATGEVMILDPFVNTTCTA